MAALARCLWLLGSLAGCSQTSEDADATGGKGPLPPDVVAVDVGSVEHIEAEGGRLVWQTAELEYLLKRPGTTPKKIGRSALGPAGFAVRDDVVFYGVDLMLGRYDETSNDTRWNPTTTIAIEASSEHLYVANCDGILKLPISGGQLDGLIPGCFSVVGLSEGRVWTSNQSLAASVSRGGAPPINVNLLLGVGGATLVGVDERGAYYVADKTFPLYRVDDDGSVATFDGDGVHVSLVDTPATSSRYRVVRTESFVYLMARENGGAAEGAILQIPIDGSPAIVVATFQAEIATCELDQKTLYYVDAGKIRQLEVD